LLPWLVLRELPLPYYAASVAIGLVLGVWVCNWVVVQLRIADPGVAVWDEFVGLWIALAPLLWQPRGWPWVSGGFILFRLFDIWKPWPVSWADRSVGGGLGVMLDDVFAGAYAAVVLAAMLYWA
jgi:phosphatidylglycerophosphatase A